MYNRLVVAVFRLIFHIMHRYRNRSPRIAPEADEVKNVLLVSTTGLGDTIMSTPAFRAARKHWPGARIHALLHRRWAALLTRTDHLDGVVIYPGKFKFVRPLLKRLRRLAPDVVLILHANDPDIVPLIYLSGAGYIVGSARSKFAFLLDQKVDFTNPDRHFVERRLDVVRAVIGDVDETGPELQLPPPRRDWAEEFWRSRGLKNGDPLVVLNPGGSHQAKQWPERHWRDLIQSLQHKPGVRLALFGSPAEKSLLDRLARDSGAADVLVETRADILEAAALLERATAMIGPDSGLAHVAASLGVPVIILFGPDNPDLSGPYRNRGSFIVLQKGPEVCPDISYCRRKKCQPNRCMTSISPAEVTDALERHLLSPDTGFKA